MLLWLLAWASAIVPVTITPLNYPCDSVGSTPVGHVSYWTNDTGRTVYLKRLVINHQASAAMIADIHVTVWHGWPGGSRVVLTAPWDRYDATPKVPAEVVFAPDYYEVKAGEHLAFQSFCTVLSTVYPPWHLPQPQFWYTTEP